MDKRVFLITLAATVSAGAAWAHHGWGSYDATKVFTISAPVESLAWADPHAHVMLKYQGATWEATLAPLFRMQSRGITQDMLKPGTPVVVEGYPSTRIAHEMQAERITVAGKAVELR
jgi:Family of unknown function (DUF6152)